MCDQHSRRDVLALSGVALAAIAGCTSTDEQPDRDTDPVSLGGSKTCDACGMVIADGYGPNGQVYYPEPYPEDRDGPAWHDSVRELYQDRFTHADSLGDPVTGYVTDYAVVDYTVESRGNDRVITGSIEADTFAPMADVVYVIESGVKGAMGPDLHPFSDETAAHDFIDSEAGTIVPAADVTLDLIRSL